MSFSFIKKGTPFFTPLRILKIHHIICTLILQTGNPIQRKFLCSRASADYAASCRGILQAGGFLEVRDHSTPCPKENPRGKVGHWCFQAILPNGVLQLIWSCDQNMLGLLHNPVLLESLF